MNPNELPPKAQLMRFIVGRWISKPIYAAARFGIADILADGPKTIEELAEETQTHACSLYRVMRALASVGIFSESNDGTFSLTPMAEGLKTGALRSEAIMFNAEYSDRAWLRFLDSIKTGEAAFPIAHGKPLTEWLVDHSDEARTFNEANAFKAATSHRAIVDSYDFSGIETLTDIGGGTGSLMIEILKANPNMEGIAADLPAVIEQATKTISDRGLQDRCKTVTCNFFERVPQWSDAYLLSHVLHDWPDDKCIDILSNCRKAMKPESRLLIVEMIVPLGDAPSVAKLLDLEMMVMTGGKERTEEEYKTLLEESGLKHIRTIPTQESISVLEVCI